METVVIAQEDGTGDKRLVAYATLKFGQTLDVTAARSFLREKLPGYMVPSEFVFLDRLPLTQNGKLDRKALLAARTALADNEGGFAAARDELEFQLTQIWEKVLRKRPIGLRDNFFDLGGHSLLAVRLISQVEKVTGRRLSLASLFHAPTIEEQAKLVRSEGWSSPWSSLVAIQPGGSRHPFFCVHAHDGGVLFWRDLARHLGPDQPFYAVQPQGLDGKRPLHSRIEDMAAHYINEIRQLQPEGPYFIGGHCLGGVIAFEMAQQLYLQGEKVGLLALFDSYAPRTGKSARRSFLRRVCGKFIRLFETVHLHLGNLLVLESGERLPYVRGKFNKALYKTYMAVGSRWIPAARNRRMVMACASHAARNYVSQIYPGKVTLFRAETLRRGLDRDAQMGWGRLAGGGLDVHLIPGYHAHIVLEPRVRLLAQQLTASLRHAQEITTAATLSVQEKNKTAVTVF
jgi:thioesterase domain-containing protein